MAINFPSNPSNNELFVAEGKAMRYNASKGKWRQVSTLTSTQITDLEARTVGVSSMSISGNTLVIQKDDSSYANVSLASFAGNKLTSYANASILPISDLVSGTQVYVEDTNSLYITDGSGWYKIATVNLSPSLTLGVESISLGSGDSIDVNYTVNEPEDTPYTVTASSTSNATINVYQANSTITFSAPVQDTTETITITATDGVNSIGDTLTMTIYFAPDWSAGGFSSLVTNPTNHGTNAQFGWDVSISNNGNYAIAGAPFEDEYLNNSGAAYIFNSTGVSGYMPHLGTEVAVSSALTNPSNPSAFLFNSDGTKLYVTRESYSTWYVYSLSTAYDPSTASYDGASSDLTPFASAATNVVDAKWGDSGTKVYALDHTDKRIYQSNCTTAYDLSTASHWTFAYLSNSYEGFDFFPDGDGFIAIRTDKRVNIFTLTTPWLMQNSGSLRKGAADYGEALFTDSNFDVYSETTLSTSGSVKSVMFNSDGTKVFVGESINSKPRISTFDMSSYPYSVRGMSSNEETSLRKDFDNTESLVEHFVFDSDGSNIYFTGVGNDKIWKFKTKGRDYSLQQRVNLNINNANTGGQNDYVGRGVAMSGDGTTAAIGIPSRKHATYDTPGSVQIWTRSGPTWTQQTELFAEDFYSEDTNSAQFGSSVDLSDDGNTLAVGALAHDKVYIFTRSGSTWSAQKKIVDGDDHTSSGGFYGTSVAITSDGNNLVIGSPSSASSGSDRGEAFVYTRSGTTWSYQATLTPSTRADRDGFGHSVTIAKSNGNTIAVGQEYEFSSHAGYAWVFTRSGSTWTQQAQIRHSSTQNGDHFGNHVSLDGSGNLLAIGAPNDQDANGNESGRAFLYERSGSTWSVIKILEDSDGQQYGGAHGKAIAISKGGSDVIIGNPFDGHNNSLYGPGKFETWSV